MPNQYTVIPLTQGYVALVDTEDTERVQAFKWRIHYRGLYADTGSGKSLMSMHRFLMDAALGEEIDHINGNGLDNRRSVNLRRCTHAENMANRKSHKNNKTGHKGVRQKNGNPKWHAEIGHQGKTIHIGYFETFDAAVSAYEAKAAELFGDFKRR